MHKIEGPVESREDLTPRPIWAHTDPGRLRPGAGASVDCITQTKHSTMDNPCLRWQRGGVESVRPIWAAHLAGLAFWRGPQHLAHQLAYLRA